MPVIYVKYAELDPVDPELGDRDLVGTGGLEAPFRTIAHALGMSNTPNYVLMSSTFIKLFPGNHVVDQTLIPGNNARNIAIQAFGTGVTIQQNFDGKLMNFTECEGLQLEGFDVIPKSSQDGTIKITNCNLSKISAVTFKDLALTTGLATGAKLIKLVNTVTEITHLTVSDVACPVGELTVVSADVGTDLKMDNFSISGVSSALTRCIDVGPNNLSVSLDNGSIVGIVGTNGAYGMSMDFGGTATQLLMDEMTIRSCQYGVYLKNNPASHVTGLRVRRTDFALCQYPVLFEAAHGSVYNCVMAKSNFGISARTNSNIDCYNNIFYKITDSWSLGNTAAIRSADSSEVSVSYCAFYMNTTIYQEANNGSILRNDYIRFINPQFTDEAVHDYSLVDTSPLVDSGRPVDYPIDGAVIDIGKYDTDRLIPSDEAAALAAKIVTRTWRKYDLGRINVQALVTAIMQEVDPTLIPQEGTTINDLMIKPHGILYQRLVDSIMLIARNQSILAADMMAGQELESFSANYYVTRIRGTLATVTVRIYFDTPTAVLVTPQDIFSSQSGLRFYPRQYIQLTSGEMSMNIEGTKYFVDVPLEAENFGTDWNVASGAITQWLGQPDVVSSLTNLIDAYPGRDEESSEELIARITWTIGNRTLVNEVGIPAIIAESFPEVMRTQVIGADDPEMTRDYFHGVHFYGKTDVYLSATELALARFDILSAEASTELSRTTIGDVPIIDIVELRVLDPDTGEATDLVVPRNKFAINTGIAENRFSMYENLTLTLDPTYVGTDLRLAFKWSPEIIPVHNFAQSPAQRVVCESMRIKHLYPVFLSFNLTYKAVIEIDEALALTEIRNYINRFPVAQEFQVSDMIDIMYRHGVDFVEQPVTVEARFWHPTGVTEYQYFINTMTIPRTYGYIAQDIILTLIS